MESFKSMMSGGGGDAIAAAGLFFIKSDSVHRTLRRIVEELDARRMPYAVIGGMALVAHGYCRTTRDVDLLMTQENADTMRKRLDGLGYEPRWPGSIHLRDMQTGVEIKFFIAGQYPGDQKPKPVSFPAPEAVSVMKDGVRYVNLETLVELKLASGMTAPARLKDLADVQEMIKTLHLDSDFCSLLHPYVREKFTELRDAVIRAPQDRADYG